MVDPSRVVEFVDRTDKAVRDLLNGKGESNPDAVALSLAAEAFIDYDCASFISELLKTKIGASYDTVKLMADKFNKRALVNIFLWHKISKALSIVRRSDLSPKAKSDRIVKNLKKNKDLAAAIIERVK